MALKCMAETNFYLEQFSGRIGCFKELTVLFDKKKRTIWERSVLIGMGIFENLFVKTADHFRFSRTQKKLVGTRRMVFDSKE